MNGRAINLRAGRHIDEVGRRYLLHVLEATGGNRKRAAEVPGINRKTLYRTAARFRLDL